ncbi:MAG: hypothetical protein AAFX78_01620 [Cyanobacteria bacterium J06638_20]
MQANQSSTRMSDQLAQITDRQCQMAPATYSDLKALFLNCTLNRIVPQQSVG